MANDLTAAPWPPEITLERDGIRLEPLSLAHEAGVLAAAADGELWNIRVTSVPEPAQTRAYIEAALAARKTGERLHFAIIDIANGSLLGCTSYHDIVPAIKRVEIGWTWYRKSVQRSHVNTLCKLMLMHHAFETLGCAVVGWRTSHLNFASQRAIERLGAKRDGAIRHHAPHRDGSVRDTVIYSMLAAEWPQAKEKLENRLQRGSVSTATSMAEQPASARQAADATNGRASVQLVPIAAENLVAVLRLNPGAVGERMVATNAVSLAQAAYSANAVPRAIMAGDATVGFIMLYDPTLDPALAAKDEAHTDAIDLWRLMIDFQQQRKGYGEAAIVEAARYAATRPGLTQMRLSYVPKEGNPAPFYQGMGFVETGVLDGSEIVMAQPLDALLARSNASGMNSD
jgi:N-acetyltransferase